MSLFGRRKKTELTPEVISQQFEECIERSQFFLATIKTLLFFLKEFSLDLVEINAGNYKKNLDAMDKRFHSDLPVRKMQYSFDRQKEEILDYLDREKKYFREKEAEFKNIIEFLCQGFTEMSGRNQEFNAQVYDGNLRMEQITYLDDIRKIKDSLKFEVQKMKQLIKDKRDSDAKKMEKLSLEVEVLKTDLEKAKDASIIDPLTGAANRLGFDTYLRKVIERKDIAWDHYSILMCDIDDFKNINDNFGHQIGDRVLMAFVQECRNIFRQDDFVARYAGDEFVIILPRASLRNAMKRAEALCKALMSKEYLLDMKDPNRKVTFTVSVGVSTLRRDDTEETFVARADRALYNAKKSGKRRPVSE